MKITRTEHFDIQRKIVANMTTESWEQIPHKYRDIIFGISVWVESHNRLTFRDEETKATRLLTTDELEEIISKYEALEKYIADVEKNTHMGYDIKRKGD